MAVAPLLQLMPSQILPSHKPKDYNYLEIDLHLNIGVLFLTCLKAAGQVIFKLYFLLTQRVQKFLNKYFNSRGQ